MVSYLECLVETLHRAGLPHDQAYQVLGALDAYATGFLTVWTRTETNREESNAHASPHLKNLRSLEAFERGLQIFVKSFEREFQSTNSPTSASPQAASSSRPTHSPRKPSIAKSCTQIRAPEGRSRRKTTPQLGSVGDAPPQPSAHSAADHHMQRYVSASRTGAFSSLKTHSRKTAFSTF